MRLIAPKGYIIGPPLRPNVGSGEAYRKRLDALIDEMNNSILYWITARWREAPSTATVAMDESWMGALRRTMRGLIQRWTKNFEELAPKLASYFAMSAAERPAGQLKDLLRDHGMTVKFSISQPIRDALDAIVQENVSLIKSVATEHLADVEQLVMRSVVEGRKLSIVTKGLQDLFDVPKKRAGLIARDQNSKATASITKLRQQEAGILQAVWMHSHGGKVPRPSHLAFSDGKLGGPVYEVNKGAYLDGVWTWPGVEINCKCACRPLLPTS